MVKQQIVWAILLNWVSHFIMMIHSICISLICLLGYQCDDHDNPADFFLDIINYSESHNGKGIKKILIYCGVVIAVVVVVVAVVVKTCLLLKRVQSTLLRLLLICLKLILNRKKEKPLFSNVIICNKTDVTKMTE